jgi:iron complex outermembrane receptor protein
VLLDGVPLHIGWDDRVDLSVLPAGAATTLTLVRGLPSVLHGPNVLGGAVEVEVSDARRLQRPASTAAADVAVEQTGAFAVSASSTVPFDMSWSKATVRAGAGYRHRAGIALPRGLADESSTAKSSPFTGEALRSNTDHSQVSGFLSGQYVSDGGRWVSISSSAYRAERGIAAEMHSETPRFWRYPHATRAVTVLSAGTGDRRSPLGGRGDMEASIGLDAGRTEIVSYTDGTFAEVADTEDADDRTVTLRLLGEQTIGPAGELRLALTYVDTRHEELLSGGLTSAHYRQRIWSAGAESVWRIGTGIRQFPSARLSIGGVVDAADTPQSGDKPSLRALREWGGRLGVTATQARGSLMVHGGLSRRARFPALRELYSGALGRFEPNPQLGPEELYAAEAGLSLRLEAVEVQGVAFYRRLNGAIEQIRLPDQRRQRVNLGTVNSGGLELLAATTVGRVGLSADLTIQRVRLSARDRTERVRPEYQPTLITGLQTRIALPLAVTTTLDARHVGRQYCLNPNGTGELTLDASTRYDVALARSFTPRTAGVVSRLEVRTAVDNVLDSAVYDQCGLPQPGRTLRLQLMVR